MDVKGISVYLCLTAVLFIINIDVFEATPAYNCEDRLRNTVSRPMFYSVGIELLKDNQQDGKGFVYSEMKIYHKLFTLLPLLSTESKLSFKTYLKMTQTDLTCYCQAFNNTARGVKNIVYNSFIYASTFKEPIDPCLNGRKFSFRGNTIDIYERMNKEYEKYYDGTRFLTRPFAQGTEFFLLDALTFKPGVFDPTHILNSGVLFYDLDNRERSVTWITMIRKFVVLDVDKSRLSSVQPCDTIRVIFPEKGFDSFDMVYIQPVLMGDDDFEKRMKCFEDIFYEFEDYINLRNMDPKVYGDSTTYEIFAVPQMGLRTDADLNPALMKEMPSIFKKNVISGVGFVDQTLKELRTWEGYNNTPVNSEVFTPGQYIGRMGYIYSPFVFAVIDKQTNMILKAGAYLRP